MAAGLMKSMVVLMVMVVASFQMQSTAAQTRHVVGDSMGWTVPNGGAADYATWVSRQTFAVGDTLVFNFATGNHDVTEVSQAAFGPCTTANPISRITDGPATVTLRTAGTHYYICTVGTHCQLGQKLNITVAASTSTPTPSASPTPAGSMPPPPPPPPSSASPFTAVVPVTFLAAALAFFF